MNELVMVQRGKGKTTSLLVAEKFGKQHKNVLRDIENIRKDLPEGSWLNFEPSEYKDSTGRKLPMFEMNRDGFSLLAMGFTGKKALEWKLKFLAAFNQMEQVLLNQQNLSWQQARLEGKAARRELTDVIDQFVEYATEQGSQNAKMYYTNITKATYRALGLIKSTSDKSFRDTLDLIHASFLSSAELIARQALLDGMNEGIHYKSIFVMARERLLSFASGIPRQMIAS